jgi:hypothetical protein
MRRVTCRSTASVIEPGKNNMFCKKIFCPVMPFQGSRIKVCTILKQPEDKSTQQLSRLEGPPTSGGK